MEFVLSFEEWDVLLEKFPLFVRQAGKFFGCFRGL